MHKLDPKATLLMACLAAALLVFIVYLPGLPGMFVFDDLGNIVRNPGVQIRDLGFDSLLRAALSSPAGDRPLSMLSFALDAYFFGLSPLAFKLTNICIHLACGLALGCVAREILTACTEDAYQALPRREISWLSLGVVLLWSVHPLNLTAVLYTVQRDTGLAALFSALAMLAYLGGRRRERSGRSGAWLIWCWTPLATLAGILCKENAALVPVFLLLVESIVLGFRTAGGRISRPSLAFFAVFLLLPGIGIAALLLLHPATLFASYAGRDYTLYERLITEARVMVDYLRWALLPDLQQLGLFHDDIAASHSLLDPATTLASCIVIAALLALAFVSRRRLPLLSLGILWFFAGHLIESTVLPLELAFEHRNYLPLFGLVFGIASTLYLFARLRGESRLVVAMLVIGIVAMGAATLVRASDWHDELSFARSEVRHHPDSPRALAELEWAYMNYVITTHDRSVVPLAVKAAARSKQADGFSINQDVGLSYMFSQLGDLPQAQRYMASAAAGARTAHISSTLQFSLQILIDMATPANQALFPSMDEVFVNALGNPRLITDACYTANILNSQSLYLNGTQDVPGAMAAIHKSVRLCPGDAQLHANFVRLLLRYRDLKDAKLELDALRALHDVRLDLEVRGLQAQYDTELHQRPPG